MPDHVKVLQEIQQDLVRFIWQDPWKELHQIMPRSCMSFYICMWYALNSLIIATLVSMYNYDNIIYMYNIMYNSINITS